MPNPFLTKSWVLFICFLSMSAAHAQTAPGATALDATRSVLSSPDSGKKVGDIDLTGFSFAREVEIGTGIRVITISTNHGGGLAAFRSDGSLIQTLKTDQITWLQLVDLNEDGVSEIVSEEVNGRGTGILQKSFNIYVVSSHEIRNVWHAESYSLDANSKKVDSQAPAKERIGYLRFDASGFGRPAKMTYLLTVPTGAVLKRASYQMRGEAVAEVPSKHNRK